MDICIVVVVIGGGGGDLVVVAVVWLGAVAMAAVVAAMLDPIFDGGSGGGGGGYGVGCWWAGGWVVEVGIRTVVVQWPTDLIVITNRRGVGIPMCTRFLFYFFWLGALRCRNSGAPEIFVAAPKPPRGLLRGHVSTQP